MSAPKELPSPWSYMPPVTGEVGAIYEKNECDNQRNEAVCARLDRVIELLEGIDHNTENLRDPE